MFTKRIKKTIGMLVLTFAVALTTGLVLENGSMGREVKAATTLLEKEVNKGKVKNATLKKELDSILKKKVKSGDSDEAKMKKLFKYVEKNYGYMRLYTTKVSKNMTGMRLYAGEMLVDKKGSCYHFAALYGMLVKRATGCKVRVGLGKTNGFNAENLQDHGWVEVKIDGVWYVFDPNMDKFAEKSSGKYYKVNRDDLKEVYNNYKGVKYVTIKK
jgi:transglutaminase-like putative cysteine protease